MVPRTEAVALKPTGQGNAQAPSEAHITERRYPNCNRYGSRFSSRLRRKQKLPIQIGRWWRNGWQACHQQKLQTNHSQAERRLRPSERQCLGVAMQDIRQLWLL